MVLTQLKSFEIIIIFIIVRMDLIASQSWVDGISAGHDCSAVQDSLPPSLHMRLGHGLASARCAPKNISCFGSTEANLTKDEPKTRKLLSESDLFNVLECSVDVNDCEKQIV